MTLPSVEKIQECIARLQGIEDIPAPGYMAALCSCLGVQGSDPTFEDLQKMKHPERKNKCMAEIEHALKRYRCYISVEEMTVSYRGQVGMKWGLFEECLFPSTSNY